jgi:hypothetical protein
MCVLIKFKACNDVLGDDDAVNARHCFVGVNAPVMYRIILLCYFDTRVVKEIEECCFVSFLIVSSGIVGVACEAIFIAASEIFSGTRDTIVTGTSLTSYIFHVIHLALSTMRWFTVDKTKRGALSALTHFVLDVFHVARLAPSTMRWFAIDKSERCN